MSNVVKRSVVIAAHKTSISLEDEFWGSLKTIAMHEKCTAAALIERIDKQRHNGNLSSAIRLFVLNYYRQKVA